MLRILSILSITLLFISCDKDDETTPEVEVENFYGLTVGNTYSYSYHQRNVDTGLFDTTSWTDEVEITNEVTINGESYFEFTTTTVGDEGTSFPGLENGVKVTTLKEESGVLQDQDGLLIFSNVANSAPYLISDNDWGDVYIEFVAQMQEQTVPAGDFDCVVNKRYAILNSGEQSPGQDVILYADGIGQVYGTISTVQDPEHRWEKRLVAFDLAE